MGRDVARARRPSEGRVPWGHGRRSGTRLEASRPSRTTWRGFARAGPPAWRSSHEAAQRGARLAAGIGPMRLGWFLIHFWTCSNSSGCHGAHGCHL